VNSLCLSLFLVPSRSSSTPLYPQSAANQGVCLDSLFFSYFQFRLTFNSIKELGSTSHYTKTSCHYKEVFFGQIASSLFPYGRSVQSICISLFHSQNNNTIGVVTCHQSRYLMKALKKTSNIHDS
jgi:hypothetical protein